MNSKTILVCDDDQDTLDVTSLILKNAGYNVLTAHEHRELTSALQSNAPDLILLDVRMPERDGFSIAEQLQVLGNSIPIIFVTACDQLIYRLYAPFVGAVDFLIKPAAPEELLRRIERAMKRLGRLA